MLLRRRQVEAMLDIKTSTIYRWMNDPENDFPQPVRLGPKMVRWHKSELEEWLANRERGIQEANLETQPRPSMGAVGQATRWGGR